MPSIEIICVRQKSPTKFRRLPIAIKAETNLKSHRLPSLFQKDFDKTHGCIYHLACSHLRHSRKGAFEAYDLLSRKCKNQGHLVFLEFTPRIAPIVARITKELLRQSPHGKLLFTSDYQFSSNKPKRVRNLTLPEFWELHRNQNVRFNALYEIVGPATA